MHPVVVILPILAAAFGPRLWAGRLMRRFDADDDHLPAANDLARRLLDDRGLALVRVEVTDLGDHYDPLARTIRLSRGHFDRRSLTAATAAAHEVGHALQHADGYWPFRLHLGLGRLARATGDVGTVLLIGVPVAAMLAKGPAPPLVLGAAAAAMLGTSLAAQLAALPSELNASFGRALPLLRGCCIDDDQARDARRILLACSLTYVSSTLNPLMVLWPWVGGPMRRPVMGLSAAACPPPRRAPRAVSVWTSTSDAANEPPRPEPPPISADPRRAAAAPGWRRAPAAPRPTVAVHGDWAFLKGVVRPAVRGWLRMTGDY